MFGSYDDTPEAPDFISQYRNLLHHYTHQRAKREAKTFWTGCGAVRKEVFSELKGFDEITPSRALDGGYRDWNKDGTERA